MTREEKNWEIDKLTEILKTTSILYIADMSGLNAEQTLALRRLCFKSNVKLNVVKNTFLRKAMEHSEKNFDELYPILKGNTSLMVSKTANAPARLIQEFRKKQGKPILKAAFVEETIYLGNDHLEVLSNLKSREELIREVIILLQSPAKNLILALQSGKKILGRLMMALEKKQHNGNVRT